MPDSSITLLPRTTCPHCWKKFAPEEVLWVASHTDLVGDPRLGAQQMQRFLPTRFDAEGNALDARGFSCQQLACPSCHLAVPAALLEMAPLFVSILGTPACGKSFFLAAMTWELRRVLAAHFGLSLLDTDPVINRILTANQESLFLSPNPDQPFALADLIRKTELQGDLYESVSYGNQDVRYPRPFLFTLQTRNYHPSHKLAATLARVLCLYDNAGEHFHPGQDTTGSPGTRHMAHAAFLLFLFDPLQDVRFRQEAAAGRSGVVLAADKPARQETVLLEAAARVRRLLGMPQNAKHQRPLIVVVTKSDAWSHLMPDAAPGDPWVTRGHLAGLDTERIAQRSGKLRGLLHRMCPEVVSAAEGFSQEVIYIAVSALGVAPASDAQGVRHIRLRDVRPKWTAVPMLYALSRWMQGLIPGVRRSQVQPVGDESL